MLLTNAMISKTLGYLPERLDLVMPPLSFELGNNFRDFNCGSVLQENRLSVAAQLREAFVWCASRFPLSFRNGSDNHLQRSVLEFVVGHSKHHDELLSASSAQAPGVVLMSADWPLKSYYRLGSLIAHESVHQALFAREGTLSPVRPRSLGYSPWKNSLRPGRLVWHSFWTFACQFTMLGESLLKDNSLRQIDPKLTEFLGDMEARVLVCLNSLEIFDLVSSNEMEQCKCALSILNDVSEGLLAFSEYGQTLDIAKDSAFEEFQMWATHFAKPRPNEYQLAN